MADPTPSQVIGTRSFVDYLQDVAGESVDDHDDEEVDFAELDSSFVNRAHVEGSTVASMTGMPTPQSTLNESRSVVGSLLSPFSPLLRQPDKVDEYLEFVSLQPCRKVSVVVRVLPCNESDQRCLFPHVKNSKDNLVQKSKSPHDMVVVKPTAFGKVIPSQVTMETARLVAQVANISSEDWARLYEFHHVIWPDEHHERHSDHFCTMDPLSRAVAQDAVVEHQSSVLISIGQVPSCIEPTLDERTLLAKVIRYCRTAMDSKAVATISMVELSEEKDTFRDLFNPDNKNVLIRHFDMKGAVLEGLTQIPLDHINEAWHDVQNISEQTVVVTINIWDNAVAQELKRSPDSHITLVELAWSSSPNASQSRMRTHTSTVSLGQVLRHLSHTVNLAVDTESTVSYRESNITKVLQRGLESSKVVLLAAVSQLSRDYESTLATLNFLRSLLVKSGKTASSPFQNKQVLHQEKDSSQYPMADHILEYANDASFLEQIISDPRQRLAKVFTRSPTAMKHDLMIETAASEEYTPVDYMKGLDMDNGAWESPVVRAETRKLSSIHPLQDAAVLNERPTEGTELRTVLSEEIVFSDDSNSRSDDVTDEIPFSRNENSILSNSESSIDFADTLLRSEPRVLAESGLNEQSLDFHSNGKFESIAPYKKKFALRTTDSYTKNMTPAMSDASYSGDIIVLENAVHQIQNMQSGLWRSSAESLTKLRETLSSQRADMQLMKSQIDTLSGTVAALNNQIINVSRERDMQIQTYEDKVQHLHSELCNALTEKDAIQIALDEAKRELQSKKTEVRRGMDSYRIVRDEHSKLLSEVGKFQVELQTLKKDNEMIVATCDELQDAVKRTKEENNELKQDISIKAAQIRDLNNDLVQLNQEHRVCEETLHRLNQSKKQEKEENELVQRSNISLTMLLEDKVKEIAILEEDSHRDKSMIESLQRQLHDRQKLQEKIIGEKQNVEKFSLDLERRLQNLRAENSEFGTVVASLNETCQDLQKKYDQTRSGNLYLEEQTATLTRVVKELEDDLETCTQAKNLADAKIQELEERIGNGKSENLQLREMYRQSEREKNDLMTIVNPREHLEELKRKLEKLTMYEGSVQSMDQRYNTTEQHENTSYIADDAPKMRALIRNLQVSTNARFHSVSRDATARIHVLQHAKEKLECSLQKTEKERDACLNGLEYGRRKLAGVTRTVGDKVLEAHIVDSESQSTHEFGTAEIFLGSHPAISSEVFLTTFPMDPLEFSSRAEEIATCLALSAKASLRDRQDENLNLRSNIYRLEEEKKAAIATLKARIRLMEDGDE